MSRALRFIIQFVVCFLVGAGVSCSSLPKDKKVVSLHFRNDPVNHIAEEAIEEITVIAPSSVVYQVRKLPTDWFAGMSRLQNGSAECVLGCDHSHFAESDIHRFDGLISLCVPANDSPKIKVRVFVAIEPMGSARFIDLAEKDLILK